MVETDLPADWDDNPDWDETNSGPPDHVHKLLATRAKLDATQAEFAALLAIPLATLRNWEQRRTMPDAAALTLIDLVFRFPAQLRVPDRAAPERMTLPVDTLFELILAQAGTAELARRTAQIGERSPQDEGARTDDGFLHRRASSFGSADK